MAQSGYTRSVTRALHAAYVADKEVIEVMDKRTKQAFKEEFLYRVGVKFGFSDGMSAGERTLRYAVLLMYPIVCYFSSLHFETLYNLLFLCGCTYMNNQAMGGARGFYRRRSDLNEQHVRTVDDFAFSEKMLTYFIAASALTCIFVIGMFLITRTVSGNYVFVGLAITMPLLYNALWVDSCSKR
jgi:hypothetical protein